MDPRCSMSYLVVTRNRLAFLREAMPRLLACVQPDEEVVVVDGASTDGSLEYLLPLQRAGKIHQLLSEPDHCEAHGWNKGFFRVRGELIKLISDDDCYHYPAIQTCKRFLQQHPEVDVVGGLQANVWIEQMDKIELVTYCQDWAFDWRDSGRPIEFGGLTLMLRRSALPHLGLLNTTCLCPDCEFTQRVSYLGRFGWFTAPQVVRIINPSSGQVRIGNRMEVERWRTDVFYNVGRIECPIPPEPGRATKLMRRVVRRLRRLVTSGSPAAPAPVKERRPASIPEAFRICDRWLEDYHAAQQGEFFCRKPEVPGWSRDTPSARNT